MMAINFECRMCPVKTETQQDLDVHYLFTHQVLNPKCSLDYYDFEEVTARELRTKWKIARKLVNSRANYILTNFEYITQSGFYGKIDRVKRWVRLARVADNYMFPQEEKSKQLNFDDPYLKKVLWHIRRLYWTAQGVKNIEFMASRQGIFLE